jgi:hypothetical protein
MLLSKLRNGAMGAAGLGIPDKATRDAWVAATTRQAAGAGSWTVTRREGPGTKPAILTASIVREVPPRKPDTDAPLYRLTLACDGDSPQGNIQLAWSPEPQTDRTFSVSADGQPGIAHQLAGQEKMGNGTAGVTVSSTAPPTVAIEIASRRVTVAELTDLRGKLKGQGANLKVIKNRLAKIALDGKGGDAAGNLGYLRRGVVRPIGRPRAATPHRHAEPRRDQNPAATGGRPFRQAAAGARER